MREFQFKKSYEELKINGDIYKLDISDDKIIEYQELLSKYQKDVEAMQNKDVNNLTKDQEKEYFEQAKKLLCDVLESILGKGTFEKIYEQSGRSLVNVGDLIVFLADMIKDRTQTVRNDRHKNYLKNKNKARQNVKQGK